MESNKSRHNKRKRNIAKFIFVLVFIIIIGFIIFSVIKGNKKDGLEGTWTVDGITNYEFDGKGNGKLKVPTNEYKFTYVLQNNKIYMDYESDKATDSDYEYSLENGKLELKGIKSTTGTFTLTKE